MLYYPGFVFTIRTVRDPFPKIFRFFMPSIILGLFLYCTFEVDDYANRLANLGISLLVYISIMGQMRESVPELSKMTFADSFMFTYIATCLLPLYSGDKGGKYFNKHNCQLVQAAVLILTVIILFVKYIRSYRLLG